MVRKRKVVHDVNLPSYSYVSSNQVFHTTNSLHIGLRVKNAHSRNWHWPRVVIEFVNPKYKDDTRTEFKKPTRLECMMQDIPKLFQKEMGSEANIGFTQFDRWFTFSPAKVSAIEWSNLIFDTYLLHMAI